MVNEVDGVLRLIRTTPPIGCSLALLNFWPAASGSELFGDRKTRHEGLDRMFVDIRSTVRVGADLVLQPIDIPELGRCCVGVEQIVDAERGAPARWQRI